MQYCLDCSVYMTRSLLVCTFINVLYGLCIGLHCTVYSLIYCLWLHAVLLISLYTEKYNDNEGFQFNSVQF